MLSFPKIDIKNSMVLERKTINHLQHILSSILVILIFGGFLVTVVYSALIIGQEESVESNIVKRIHSTKNDVAFSNSINELIKLSDIDNQEEAERKAKKVLENVKYTAYEMILDARIDDEIKRKTTTKQEVKNSVDKLKIIYFFISTTGLLLLLTIRGWNRIKVRIKKLTLQQIEKFELNELANSVELYKGATNFAYRFFKKKLVLGPTFFLQKHKKEVSNFILQHELSHLRYYDAIVKNLMINLTSPIYFVLLSLATITVFTKISYLTTHLMPDNVSYNDLIARSDIKLIENLSHYNINKLTPLELSTLVQFNMFVIINIIKLVIFFGLLFYSYKKLLVWFTKLKEFLADEYAYLEVNSNFPEMELENSKFHPTSTERRNYVSGRKVSLSIAPLFLSVLLIIYSGGNYFNITYWLSPLVLIALILFLILDIYSKNVQQISVKNLLLITFSSLILFYLELASQKLILLMNSSNDALVLGSKSAIFYYILFLILAYVWFIIKQRLSSKRENSN